MFKTFLRYANYLFLRKQAFERLPEMLKKLFFGRKNGYLQVKYGQNGREKP